MMSNDGHRSHEKAIASSVVLGLRGLFECLHTQAFGTSHASNVASNLCTFALCSSHVTAFQSSPNSFMHHSFIIGNTTTSASGREAVMLRKVRGHDGVTALIRNKDVAGGLDGLTGKGTKRCDLESSAGVSMPPMFRWLSLQPSMA